MTADVAQLRRLYEAANDDQLARMCALGFDVRELSQPKLKWWVRPVLILGEISRRIRRTWSRIRR
ncbi:hypothetical protein [Caulobacter rhizosphaerae]|uniref:hypothetical protein n=1 Tax=Caulobacter rhizosphaerae TaxID=2010972 RepID=UPI0013D69BC1|nr:hypothetical protein [Caulobacter rhizosphaerae]